MLVKKDGSSEGLMPDGHDENFGDIISSLPNMLPAPAPALASTRPQARGKSSSSASILRMLSGAAKAAALANQVINGGNGGGGYSDWNNYDASGFSAGLQQQTWSSTADAASDPIQ